MKLKFLWCLALCFVFPAVVCAQFDTMDSPVVKDAKAALEKGDVLMVLKWVKPEGEVEVCEVFTQAVTVRAKGPEAKALADKYFCETLVRLYQTGIGESFSGLMTASKNPVVAATYHAIDSGSAADLSKLLSEEVTKGLSTRLSILVEKKNKSAESMDAEKEYVGAYTEFMRYVTRLAGDAAMKIPQPPAAKK